MRPRSRRSPRSTRSLLEARRRGVPRRPTTAEPGHRAAGDDGRRPAVASGEERHSDRPRPRVLPRPLRLPARAGRLRPRSQQRSRSVPAERAPGAPRHGDAARRSHGADAGAGAAGRDGEFVTIAHVGFAGEPPVLPRASEVGDAVDRRAHADARRSAGAAPARRAPRSSSGARPGSTTSFRASRRKGRLRSWRSAARRAPSRSAAKTWRCWRRSRRRRRPRSRTAASTAS